MIDENQYEELQTLFQDQGMFISEDCLNTLVKLVNNFNLTTSDIENKIGEIQCRDKNDFDVNELKFFQKSLEESKNKKKGKKQQKSVTQKDQQFQNLNDNQHQIQSTPTKNDKFKSSMIQSIQKSQMDLNFEKRNSNISSSQNFQHYNPSQLPQPAQKMIKKTLQVEDLLNDAYQQNGLKTLNEVREIRYNNSLYSTFSKSDNLILERIEQFKEHYRPFIQKQNEEFEDFVDTSNNSQINEIKSTDKVFLAGRIACNTEGKINDTSIKFELSSKLSYLLDISKLQEYCIFPNQIVAVYGYIIKNEGKIVVHELYSETVEIQNPIQENGQQVDNSNNEQFLIASGPYTQPDSIRFQPLEELLKIAKNKKVEHIVLMGPFLDNKNKIIQEGELVVDGKCIAYNQLFTAILDLVQKELGNNGKVYIVPSPDDIISNEPLPQSPINNNFKDKYQQKIKFLSNPSSLIVSEQDNSRFTFLSSKLMLDLMQNVIVKGQKYSNKMETCLQQLIQQQQIIPLYPTSDVQNLQNSIEQCQFDLENFKGQFPNLIVLPSPLQPSVKKINSTLFLNPGFLCKGEQGGSYSILTYFNDNNLRNENKIRIDFFQL